MGFFANDLGIDLGTSNTKVYVKKKGVILNEPTILVLEAEDTSKIVAAGNDARILLGRTTEGYVAMRPMKEGVITEFEMAKLLLEFFIRRAIGYSYIVRPRVFVSFPCSISPIEQRALCEATREAGARQVLMAPKPFVSALGCTLPVYEPTGSMVVDIGGGTTDIAVISYGGIVISHSIRVGGMKMDEAIINYIKQRFDVQIGDRTAEEVKLDLAAALPLRDERRAMIRGRDMQTNRPQISEITSTDIYEAIQEPCRAILDAIKWVLERTPPELAADIMHNGVHLSGGASQLYGLDQLIANELGLMVVPVKEPAERAVTGLGHLIDNYQLMQEIDRTSILQTF